MSKLVQLVLLTLIGLSDARAYSGFSQISTERGLSHESVTCILQDKQGFLWLGTKNGLNRYDSLNFKHYKYAIDGSGLSSADILCLLQDRHGMLWVGTNDGLNRYNPKTGLFSYFKADPETVGSLGDNRIRVLRETRDGELWIGTDRGLHRFQPETQTFEAFRRSPKNPHSISHNRIHALFEDSSGVLWVGTGGGLNSLDRATGHFTAFRRSASGISANHVNAIFEDRQGTLWIGTYGGGLNRFDRKTKTFRAFRNELGNTNSLASDTVLSIHEDRLGRLWIGTDLGLDKFDWPSEEFVHYMGTEGDEEWLEVGGINVIFEDRSGLLWVGSERGGAFKMEKGPGHFTLMRHDPNKSNTLSSNRVNALLEDHSGWLVIGTTGGGLDLYDPIQKRFTNYRSSPDWEEGLASNDIQSLYEDKAGVLWIGTNGAGLDRFDRYTGWFTHFRNSEDPSSIVSDRVWCLHEDRSGGFWIGTEDGLDRMDRETGIFTHFIHDPSEPSSLSHDGVWSIHEDRAGRLWIGTAGGGLDRFDGAEGGFSHYQNNPDDPNSLSNDVVLSIYGTRSGMLWIGTWGGGLNRLDPDTGEFKVWRKADGLPEDKVYGVLGDDRDNLWISTNRGLAQFDTQTQEFTVYDTSDGLQGDAFNLGAFARGKRGKMFFGGRNGLNIFSPTDMIGNQAAPGIAILQLQSLERTIAWDVTEAIELDLEHEENYLTFEFAALDFNDPERNKFRYMMEGVDASWRTAKAHLATYPKLDPSEYVFRVIGSNNEGVWNETGVSVNIRIRSPWWQTSWFFALSFLAASSLLIGLFVLQRQRLKKQEREALVALELAKKTHELEEARDFQLAMLPRKVPKMAAIEVAVSMETAAEVGGDYYDFVLEPNGTLTSAIGDATGHGLMAGTLVAATKSLFLSLAEEPDLVDIVKRASKALRGMGLRKMFMAFTVARFKGNRVELVAAGMPAVLVYRAQEARVERFAMRGLPLGTPAFPYQICHLELACGDTLLLLSDGLEEMFNEQNEMLTEARVNAAFKQVATRPVQEVIDHLTRTGREWAAGRPSDDDVTLLAFRYTEAKIT